MTLLKEIITNSPEETEQVGFELARLLENDTTLPSFIALYGDLGVGKTAFVRGFARVFSPAALVRSPTFALVNEYPTKEKRRVFHFDMYRITDEDDLYSIGYYDYLDDGSICLVEWSENIPYAIPDRHIRVDIEKTDLDAPNERRIKIIIM
ncbi:MAG: tRNA (adenosine(37)-N6)-threonylcarbamoyltransferase complex ATPase subunit type 1 TsaE [Clostridia bacterium]|nr:tRNA (adenosine(37)-N6)-threonylcarbamoyltransferase complex ATPase subunit type 1 TsaE [Clostridia bacterium]